MIQLRKLLEKNPSESSGRCKIDSGSSSSSSSSPFNWLPEECISSIISFTSPEDACVSAVVSKIFKSAVKSDIIWEKFISEDYKSLIPPSRVFSSKKELYFSLCHDPLLIEDGKKSIWLEKANGKRCTMLSPMNFLSIHSDTPPHLHWFPSHEARFELVAEVPQTYKFEFRCRMNTCVLSSRTRYSVNIVFKKGFECFGFKNVAMKAEVWLVGDEAYKRLVCFDMSTGGRKDTVKPVAREDGWMEVEIGEFFNEGGLYGDEIVETSIFEGTKARKRGLIIQGIEIRPSKILPERKRIAISI
ncbi:PREDICTED: F-box protein PP2-B10-like [Camelina sativa]|uniref:F-box protein PP2-B10-like n=1 Tax=Camelina sativa TaxID=90675 RepID=A0ABM1RTC2_CAMSA|nr:PREDICTED: F-box protein PP2-B10-like [Camelina sativa]